MTIFQLLVYSCISTYFFSGDVAARTCRWDAQELYATAEQCKSAADGRLNRAVGSDVMEERKIEKARCDPLKVFGANPSASDK